MRRLTRHTRPYAATTRELARRRAVVRFALGRRVLPVLLLCGIACTRTAPAGGADLTRSVTTAPAVATATDDERWSLYDLPASWRDQDGRALALAALGGRPVVLAMVYTSCTASCPLTVASMRRIEREARADARFVLVSLDPDRDTPERLAAFARERGLDPARWTLLAGSDDAVRELAAALGLRYRRLSAAELAHSNTLTVLDPAGAVAWQGAGTDGTDAAVAALHSLAR